MKLGVKFGLLAVVVCTQVHAVEATSFSSQTFISASNAITSLSFQLIDLAPNDGIAPSISFTSGAAGYDWGHRISLTEQLEDTVVETNQLLVSDTVSVTSSSGGAQSSIGTNFMRSEVHLTEQSYVDHAVITQDGDYGYLPGKNFFLESAARIYTSGSLISAGLNRVVLEENEQSPTGYLYRLEGTPEDVAYFTLSANTEMVISGTASHQFYVNPGALTSYSFNDMQINVLNSASLTTHFLDPADGATTWTSEEALRESLRLSQISIGDAYLYQSCPEQNCSRERVQEQAFSFTLSNTSALAAKGRMTAFTNASLFLRAAAPVPEPSTYALIGIGLLGVFGAVHSRKAAVRI
jgi:hypothetical protein